MSDTKFYGYFGKILEVDLGKKEIKTDSIDENILRNYVGGAALGIKYIYDSVSPETRWSDPGNKLFLGSGPLGGTRIGGSGAIAVVTKGALTNGMASSQANGFFGAYLRFSGYDAMVVAGAADEWSYIHIHDGNVEIKNAMHLVGKTTLETESLLKEELGKKKREASVVTIGPAGENLVRFSMICADGGHIAAHNGVGAVMGSKKLKAIIIEREKNTEIPLKDDQDVKRMSKVILDHIMSGKGSKMAYEEGTVGGVIFGTQMGNIPVKNYTTGVNRMSPEVLETYSTQNIRENFNAKPSPCWACGAYLKNLNTRE